MLQEKIIASRIAGNFFLVAGPCSAENPAQLSSTANGLRSIPSLGLIRAGIWKPRTRPDSFEGVGNDALEWLKDIKEATGIPVTVEVANKDHVEAALKASVDVLWIGARTTVNPFTVQEIADAIKGYDVPVMIKNPVNPDLGLWIGAIERFEKNGVHDLVAVHRGFSQYGETFYRNHPMWQIPVGLMERRPDIPVLCDPSHIAGDRSKIPGIAQKALDLNMSGLMIESHFDPDNALSDKNQQLSPEDLCKLIAALVLRSEATESRDFQHELSKLRYHIDQVDEELINLLSQRMNIVSEIGNYKKAHDVTILQLERWREILQNARVNGERAQLSLEFVNAMMEIIHQESIRIQTDIFNRPSS